MFSSARTSLHRKAKHPCYTARRSHQAKRRPHPGNSPRPQTDNGAQVHPRIILGLGDGNRSERGKGETAQ